MDNKFSVLMSVYIKEKADYFNECMESLLKQTVQPNEIVIVQDGPVSVEIDEAIINYKKKYPGLLKIIPLKQNKGLGLALAEGIKNCTYELIARMDTDDIANLERCKKQLEFLNKHLDISVVGGQIEEFIGVPSNVVGRREVPLTDMEIKKYIRKRCPFNHMTVMFRKSDIMKAGNYQDWFWNEDYYLWIRLLILGVKFANLPDVLVKVRTGPDMYQRRGGKEYFMSEKNIQKLMLENDIIGFPRYLFNVSERMILQVLMPNWLRGIIFRKFARK